MTNFITKTFGLGQPARTAQADLSRNFRKCIKSHFTEHSSFSDSISGLDVNIGIKGLMSLEPFIDKISLADTEHSIMAALIYKMEHSDKVSKDLLKHGLKEYIFL